MIISEVHRKFRNFWPEKEGFSVPIERECKLRDA
jgi:hypothetical protein